MHASLQPLFDAISKLDFEESGHLTLTAATWVQNNVSLHLTIHEQDQEDQRWRLDCEAVRRSRIVNDQGIDTLYIETDHPLLLPHTDPVSELYFSSRPSDPDATVGRLVEAHNAVVGGWFDCLHFFNVGSERSLRNRLDGGFGKLAEGPRTLIDRYAAVLRACNVAVSSPASRPPAYWNGQTWSAEVEPLYAVILGETYLVSPRVVAEKV